MTSDELSYGYLRDLAQLQERTTLEFKSADPLFRNDKNELKKIFGKELGAFVNSSGGLLVFGFEDDGNASTNLIPEKIGRQPIATYLTQLIRASLEPVVYSFEVLDIFWNEDRTSNCLVISVKPSEISPHQSKSDNKYYVRVNDVSVAGEHWILNALFNKKTSPTIRISDEAITAEFKNATTQNIQCFFVTIKNILLRNIGNVTAQKWCITLKEPGEIFQYGETIFKNKGKTANQFYSETALFPNFIYSFNLCFLLPVGWIDSKQNLILHLTLHCDNAMSIDQEIVIPFSKFNFIPDCNASHSFFTPQDIWSV